ncbi:MAG TPA: rRNA maturation RNase YbeY [Methyloceanibacter sp.]|nr:rRNA maturation RNase YbeY [Methyloceanibacter sp.]
MAEGGPSRKRAAPAGIPLEVEVVRHDDAWAAAGVTETALKRAAQAAFRTARPRARGSHRITLVLAGDEEMRRLNRTFRGKDASTNVLSFPSGDAIAEPGFLGDVVLAHGTVAWEARQRNIPLKDHAAHLVVHGTLHLLGFDHADDAQADEMEQLERKALAALGIADPYAETAAGAAEART